MEGIDVILYFIGMILLIVFAIVLPMHEEKVCENKYKQGIIINSIDDKCLNIYKGMLSKENTLNKVKKEMLIKIKDQNYNNIKETIIQNKIDFNDVNNNGKDIPSNILKESKNINLQKKCSKAFFLNIPLENGKKDICYYIYKKLLKSN